MKLFKCLCIAVIRYALTMVALFVGANTHVTMFAYLCALLFGVVYVAEPFFKKRFKLSTAEYVLSAAVLPPLIDVAAYYISIRLLTDSFFPLVFLITFCVHALCLLISGLIALYKLITKAIRKKKSDQTTT